MRILTKLVWNCRFTSSVGCVALRRKTDEYLCTKLFCNYTNNMSQKTITSFFTKTPKKSNDIKEVADKSPTLVKRTSLNKENNKEEQNSVTNFKDKRSSKRQRLNSSDSDSPESPVKSAPESDKKKKVKRQRIESSGSETEIPKTESPSPDLKVDTNALSPKSKQTPKENIAKTTIKSSSTASNDNKNKKSSPSPKSKVTVKEEVLTPKVKSEKIVNGKAASSVKVEENGDSDTKNMLENDNGPKVLDTDYNPAKSKYHPINDACWSKGEEVPYLALAKTLEVIEATSARLKMIDILSNYFRSVIVLTPEDLLPSVYMCLNQLAPAYHSLELGIAETYLMKAVGQCTGRSVQQLRAAASRAGDLGAAAARARATQRTMFRQPALTARRVFHALREIARMTGHASVNKKIAKIQSLFTACRDCEAKYLVRSLEGKLRIGLAEQSLLQALALAVTTTPPNPEGVTVLDASKGLSAEEFKSRVDSNAFTIKKTYCECPNYEALIPALLQHGVQELPRHCALTPGVPLKPMLAHPARAVQELFDRFEGSEFTCEWKYDGERAQIHVPSTADGSSADFTNAAIFSRNQENNTSKYPDVINRLPSLLKAGVSSCVLDCEVVAYDTQAKQILPFQILSTRKRKDANEADIRVQVCVYVFDLLYLNGAALVGAPLRERRALLRDHCNRCPGEWEFAASKDCSNVEEVQTALADAVKGSCEGLMVKALEGPRAAYDIARRSHNWLKLKKDYLEGVGDTVDAVVIGGYLGRGRRAGVYGGFLLACRDPQGDEYQSLCKIGTGFSDEQLHTLSAQLNEHLIDAPRTYYRFDPSHRPDAWFSCARVWEVRCADLSLSPAHRAAAGLVDRHKGISLRFPRFVRVREDKTPEQATSAQQIAQLYLNQDQVKNHAPAAMQPEDEFY